MGKWWDPTSAMKVTTILKTAMVIVTTVTCSAASFTVPAKAEARCLASETLVLLRPPTLQQFQIM